MPSTPKRLLRRRSWHKRSQTTTLSLPKEVHQMLFIIWTTTPLREGLDDNPPKNALDWLGNPWDAQPPTRRASSQQPLYGSRSELPALSRSLRIPTAFRFPHLFGGRDCSLRWHIRQRLEHRRIVARQWHRNNSRSYGRGRRCRRDPMAMLPSADTIWPLLQALVEIGKTLTRQGTQDFQCKLVPQG